MEANTEQEQCILHTAWPVAAAHSTSVLALIVFLCINDPAIAYQKFTNSVAIHLRILSGSLILEKFQKPGGHGDRRSLVGVVWTDVSQAPGLQVAKLRSHTQCLSKPGLKARSPKPVQPPVLLRWKTNAQKFLDAK